MKRALGAGGVVAGALDAQLDGPACARVAVGDLVGGGQRQRDLLRRHRLQQQPGDQVVDDAGLDRPARGRVDVIGARVTAVVVAALAAVQRRHRPPARAAAHDPLAERAALARRALAGAGVVAASRRSLAR